MIVHADEWLTGGCAPDEPHEIGRAMAFPDSYIVKGNKRERVRQYGNAVTPPVMDIILRRCIDSLSGEAEPA